MYGGNSASIDELLDRAVRASNSGDRVTATALADQVLAVDHGNHDAEDLLDCFDKHGEIRRLAMMFIDLVDSTSLSTRMEPESYRTVVSNYRDEVLRVVNHYEGHVTSTKGDGLLAVFGYPKAHENDTERAVSAALDILRVVARISTQSQRTFGVGISVRVGVHRGLVYLDTAEDDIYGFAVNLASRVASLAEPGTAVVSDSIAALVGSAFELAERPAASVKGVNEPVRHHRLVGELPQSPAPSPPPLVGRERERVWLERTWQQVCDGESTSPGVAFRGEPGIGKTRLARVAAELAEASGAAVIELRGSPLHTHSGLHPVRRLLERRCGITRRTDGRERLRLLEAEVGARDLDATTMVPLLAPVLGVGPEHGYHPAAVEGLTLYQMIGAGVLRYVLACRDGRPGLVIAEDVHWYDPSTMELVEALLHAADGRLLVALTGRDGTWLRSGWPVTSFELGPLSDHESDALIDALQPAATDAQRTAVRIRCDGVPFYIEHVVAGLDDIANDEQVPEALYAPLFARLHARTDVLPVVEAAAVIGRNGDVGLLRAVVEGAESGADVDSVVAELVSAGVFESTYDGWRFRHELLREVAAELAPPSRHRELHARAAMALVDAASDTQPDWRVVAAHYEHAERFDEAVDAYRKASVDARRRGAAQEALACLTNALLQLEGCEAGPARDVSEIAIRLERGFLSGAADGGTSGGGPADLERCLELAGAGDYPDELLATLTALIGYYVPRAELGRAQDLLESLFTRITTDRRWSSAAIASSLGTVTWLQGDFAAARGHLMRALADESAAAPDELDTAWWVATDPIASAHNYLALTHAVAGDLDGADCELAASVSRAESLGYPQNAFNRAMTYFMQIWVRLEAGQIEEAITLVAGLRRLSEQSGLDLWRLVSATEHATVKALAALNAGADAATLAAGAHNIAARVDASRFIGLNVYLTFHDAVIARLLIAAGNPDQARNRLDLSLRHAEETRMHFEDAELLRVRAHTFSDPRQRRAALDDALASSRKQGATLFELRCLLDYFEQDAGGDRSDLAAVVERFPDGARWPELALAERILS